MVTTDPDEISHEESHLDHYCQMFCILLEQFHQAVCLFMACLVIIDPDETFQSGVSSGSILSDVLHIA